MEDACAQQFVEKIVSSSQIDRKLKTEGKLCLEKVKMIPLIENLKIKYVSAPFSLHT